MVRVFGPAGYKVAARFACARKRAPPLIVIPTAPSVPSVLEAVKVWLGKGGACCKVCATANLDSSCARRPGTKCGSGRRNGIPGRTKKPIREEETDQGSKKEK